LRMKSTSTLLIHRPDSSAYDSARENHWDGACTRSDAASAPNAPVDEYNSVMNSGVIASAPLSPPARGCLSAWHHSQESVWLSSGLAAFTSACPGYLIRVRRGPRAVGTGHGPCRMVQAARYTDAGCRTGSRLDSGIMAHDASAHTPAGENALLSSLLSLHAPLPVSGPAMACIGVICVWARGPLVECHCPGPLSSSTTRGV
jgi:hypothetical protein